MGNQDPSPPPPVPELAVICPSPHRQCRKGARPCCPLAPRSLMSVWGGLWAHPIRSSGSSQGQENSRKPQKHPPMEPNFRATRDIPVLSPDPGARRSLKALTIPTQIHTKTPATPSRTHLCANDGYLFKGKDSALIATCRGV